MEAKTLFYKKVQGFCLKPSTYCGAILFGFANLEHLGPARWASSRSSGPFVLHYNGLGSLHFFLSSAFDTICFHLAPPFEYERYTISSWMSIGFCLVFKDFFGVFLIFPA